MVKPTDNRELLPGTLDMLVLRIVETAPKHGYAIAQSIRRLSQDVLQVEQGSLYPALYRMEKRGWIRSNWGQSETGRRVKLYSISANGRRQLQQEASGWDTMVEAVGRIMGRAH